MRGRFAGLADGWRKLGYELGLGIGIATGYATLGRIGFEGRYDYAAIGNAVILASRLGPRRRPARSCSASGPTPPSRTLSRPSRSKTSELKGMSRPVPAYLVLGFPATVKDSAGGPRATC